MLADESLREVALKNHDLSPILPFEAVYGEGENCLGKATAITIDPRRPYNSDGEVNTSTRTSPPGGFCTACTARPKT